MVMLYPDHKLRRPALLCAALGSALLFSGCADESHEAVRAKALAYQGKSDLNAAVIVLKNSLEKSPKDGEFRLLLARVYLQQGDPVSAEKEVRLAIAAGQP